MSRTLLDEVHGQLVKRMESALASTRYITLVMDFWTDVGSHGVYACLAITEDRSEYLLDVVDASDASHTATYIAGGRVSDCPRFPLANSFCLWPSVLRTTLTHQSPRVVKQAGCRRAP
jgi:hypothetical protein